MAGTDVRLAWLAIGMGGGPIYLFLRFPKSEVQDRVRKRDLAPPGDVPGLSTFLAALHPRRNPESNFANFAEPSPEQPWWLGTSLAVANILGAVRGQMCKSLFSSGVTISRSRFSFLHWRLWPNLVTASTKIPHNSLKRSYNAHQGPKKHCWIMFLIAIASACPSSWTYHPHRVLDFSGRRSESFASIATKFRLTVAAVLNRRISLIPSKNTGAH